MKAAKENIGVIIFDGNCVFCTQGSEWVAKWDRKGIFAFASQGSRYATNMADLFPYAFEKDSIVFIKNGKSYIKSRAIEEIIKDLPHWSVFRFIFKLVPRAFADWIYDLIAKHRKKLLKSKTACTFNPELASRCID